MYIYILFPRVNTTYVLWNMSYIYTLIYIQHAPNTIYIYIALYEHTHIYIYVCMLFPIDILVICILVICLQMGISIDILKLQFHWGKFWENVDNR